MLDRLQQYRLREPYIVVCLLFAAVAFNLSFLYPSFSVDALTGTDLLLHTILVESVIDAVNNGQNFLDPWQGSMGMGHPMFHYYQHLPHVALGLFQVLTFGVFPADGLVNWSAYLLVSIFPLSIYWSLRRFGFDQISSAMGGLVASLVATGGTQGFDYISYIGGAQGLYTQLWAMVLMPPALASGYRVLREGRGYFLAVLFLAATLMSHLLYGYMAFITLGVLIFIFPIRLTLPWDIGSRSGATGGTRAQRRRSQRSGRPQTPDIIPAAPPESETLSYTASVFVRVRRLAVVFLLVVAVTSYFLVPFFLDLGFFNSSVHIDPRNYDSLGHSLALQVMFQGSMFDFERFPSLSILIIGGFAVCLLQWRSELYLIPITIFMIWLLLYFGRPTWGSLIDLLPLSQNILMFRFIGGIHLGGIFLVAVALGASWRWAMSRDNIWYPVAALVLTLAVLLPAFIERRSYLKEDVQRLESCQQREILENQDVNLLLDEIKSLPEGRVYAGRFFYSEPHWGFNYRAGCILLQARALEEGLDTMASLFHRYSLTSDLLDDFDESKPEQYNLFNVRYVIAPEGQSFPDFVKPIQQFGSHVLYEVETTGYFDLVGSEMAFAGEKTELLPAASTWLASGLPAAKQHPMISIGVTSKEIPDSLSAAPELIFDVEVPANLDRGTVIAEEIRSDYFSADVVVERDSILLLKASYHPNWQATVDGVETDTLMLMPGFIGVELTPGEHSVRLEYRARGLRTVLLVVGLLILALIAVVESRRSSISNWLRPRVLARFDRSDKRA